jgi:hypothetical protein
VLLAELDPAIARKSTPTVEAATGYLRFQKLER